MDTVLETYAKGTSLTIVRSRDNMVFYCTKHGEYVSRDGSETLSPDVAEKTFWGDMDGFSVAGYKARLEGVSITEARWLPELLHI